MTDFPSTMTIKSAIYLLIAMVNNPLDGPKGGIHFPYGPWSDSRNRHFTFCVHGKHGLSHLTDEHWTMSPGGGVQEKYNDSYPLPLPISEA